VSSRIEGRYAVEWPPDAEVGGCRVVAIGDSTLAAEGLDSPTQLWIYRALESIHLQTREPLRLVVLTKPGARLKDVERLTGLVDEEEPDVVVVAVGTNDVVPSPGIVNQLMDYTSRYRQMVRRLSGPGCDVIVAGVGNLWYVPAMTGSPLRSLFRPVAAGLSWYVDRAIRNGVDGLPHVEKVVTRVVDRTMWEGRDWLYNPDGFHPSAAGHEVWANLARPALARAVKRYASAHGADGHRTTAAATSDAVEYEFVRTSQGFARVRDTGGPDDPRPVVIVMPDSPNVLEHHESTFRTLGPDFRVIGLEMPGAGYTDLRPDAAPSGQFDFSLRAGATWILDVMRERGIQKAIVTASCVNGLYAATAAVQAPHRVVALVLCQTPSVAQLQAWARRTIPWVLRNRLTGDLLLRLVRRRVAGWWYGRALGINAPPELRATFADIAREGFRAGGTWRLAPLITAIRSESDVTLRDLDTPTTVLWGDDDRTHRRVWTDPESLPGTRKRTLRLATGHFPELEDPERFADEVRAMARQVWPDHASSGPSPERLQLLLRQRRGCGEPSFRGERT
jgi:pimeloyl-ACP methyl ester carboxylesterase/lysophospholipase L1-like esterase